MPNIKFSTGSLPINSNLQRVIEKSLSEVNVNNLFNYGAPKGEEFIRNAIANLYNNSKIGDHDEMKSDDIMITTSAQQGLNISFATIFGSEVVSGKTIVLLQQPCFFGVIRLMKKYCLGKSWIDVVTFDNISELLEKVQNIGSTVNKIVIYLCSNYQPNSGNILSEKEKSDICKYVRESTVETTIIEDNPYDFLYGTEKRPSTLFELLPNNTILIGGFSKILAPGIRVGYMITRNQSFGGRLYREKIDQDLFTSTLCQQVCANALQDETYLPEWRRFVQKRVQYALQSLEEIFGEEKKSGKIEWTNTESGIFVYVRFFNFNHEGVASVQSLLEISKNDFELELEPSGYCYLDGCSRLETRINVILPESDEILREGFERLKRAYHKWTISPTETTSIRSIVTTNEEEHANKQILKVVITSGGTAVPIDSVRYITNSSTGTTGAQIAEEFVKRGHIVYYIHSKNGRIPSIKHANLKLLPFFTFDEYLEVLKQTTIECNPDVVILSAAVSDYGVQQAHEGKISSDLDTQIITLVKLPKVISLVKQWNPKVFLVGFKLLAGATTETLIDTAYKSGIRNHCNLTVANTTTKDDMSNFGKRIITIITPEKSIISTTVRDLPIALATHVEKRVSHKHYKTIVIPSDHKDYINYEQTMGETIQAMFSNIQKGYTLGLFDSYFKDEKISESNPHFGFVAIRAPEPFSGFLITSRGSDKSQPTIKDIVYVSKVDFESRKLFVHSTHGQKASLNANVAGWLFENRSSVSLILHAHIFPSCNNKTDFDYSPGTQEDVDAVARKMSNNEKIVEIPDHGIISVSSSSRIEEAIDALGEGHAYFKFAHLYDMIYARFQKSTDLIDILDREFENKEKKVLDLACGTGEVSRLMYERGFKHISFADQSDKMLNYANKKFIDNFGEDIATGISKHVTSMQNLQVNHEKFDLIVIRQAINYAMNLEGLELIVKNCYEHLNDGGKLIFNTTNFKLDQEDKFSKMRELNYATTDGHVGIASASRNSQVPFDVYIREGNLLYRVDSDKGERKEIRMLVHAQHCVVERVISESGDNFIFDRHVLFDLNKFGMFTQQEITNELLNAQFKQVKCYGKGLCEINEENSNQSPSLYFVATKN